MKKRFFTVLPILFLTFTIGYAQPYVELARTCFSALEAGHRAAFEELYPEIFYSYFKAEIPEFAEALEQIETHNYQAAASNIRLVLEEEGVFMGRILSDPDLLPLHGTRGWDEVVELIDQLQKGQDLTLKAELNRMMERDQSVRLLVLLSEQMNGPQNEMTRRLYREMKRIDSLQSVRVQAIVDQYGWLGTDVVGEDGSHALFLCIQHADGTVLQEKYLPLLRQAVEQGQAEPMQYAYLTDRVRMNRGERQVYGTQTIRSADPSLSYVVPIEDPDRVDALRQEVGLEPLEDYLRSMGMEWNLEQYKARLPEIEERYRQYYLQVSKSSQNQ